MADRSGVHVRRARENDLPGALGLFRELDRFQEGWRVFEPRAHLAAEAEALYRAALADPGALHVVAQQGDRLVGMGLARITVPSSMSDERAAEISNIYVRPGFRGLGVGRAVIAELARWASGQGVRRLFLKTYNENEEALEFWTAVGFRPRYVQMTALADDLARRKPQ